MKTIRVEEVFESETILSAIIPEDASMEDVIRKLVSNPNLRGVFLIDETQRFAGIITRRDLLNWASLKLGDKVKNVEVPAREIFRLIYSTKAKDLAHGDWQTLGVRLDDDLATALNQMIHHELIDIPVFDAEGRIIGDLKLSHILLKVLEIGKAHSS